MQSLNIFIIFLFYSVLCVIAEQIYRSASMLATWSLVELGRRFDERRLADAVRQTLAQVAHRATSHDPAAAEIATCA